MKEESRTTWAQGIVFRRLRLRVVLLGPLRGGGIQGLTATWVVWPPSYFLSPSGTGSPGGAGGGQSVDTLRYVRICGHGSHSDTLHRRAVFPRMRCFARWRSWGSCSRRAHAPAEARGALGGLGARSSPSPPGAPAGTVRGRVRGSQGAACDGERQSWAHAQHLTNLSGFQKRPQDGWA